MAEIKVNDLPVMTTADFTDNDLFLVIDNGRARLLQRPTFQAWMLQNVQGEKGDTGVAGRDGVDGRNGTNGRDGANGLSAYQVAQANGFVGTEAQWIASLKGSTGATGANGSNGWSPVITVVSRGDDRVLRLNDWVGGTGTKPTTTGYLSETGIVSNIANATNVRGLQGLQGIQGETGATGATGADGLGVNAVEFNNDGTLKLTMSDSSEITSNSPPQLTGWATYKDGQYTEATPLTVPSASTLVIPNNANGIIQNLPTGVTSFYNATSQKILLADEVGLYSVRVRFKIKPITLSSPEFIQISYYKETTDIPFEVDIPLRGDNTSQAVNVTTTIYGDASIVANGLSARIKTSTTGIQIYNAEFVVTKVV